MEFEFDEAKSGSNKAKHRIDFVEAQVLWDDPELLEVPLKTQEEPRSMMIGKIGGELWSVIVTYRSERIRIISVRRSRTEEEELYES